MNLFVEKYFEKQAGSYKSRLRTFIPYHCKYVAFRSWAMFVIICMYLVKQVVKQSLLGKASKVRWNLTIHSQKASECLFYLHQI